MFSQAKLFRSLKAWLLLKAILVALGFFFAGFLASLGFVGAGIMLFIAISMDNLVGALLGGGIIAFIYQFLHKRFLGSIRFTKALVLVLIPMFILGALGLEGFWIALVMDYIIFHIIYNMM